MFLAPILIIIITRYLRKSLQTAKTLPKWDKLFLAGFIASIIILILQASFFETKLIFASIAYAMLFALSWLLLTNNSFRSARPVIFASLPLAILSFADEMTGFFFRDFNEKWENVFATLITCALVWMIAMLIINKKQRKAIQKERIKAEEIEKENKITSALKAQLEIQVAERTAALTTQKEALEQTLNELKSTQAQLIQSEKMASLGELTAGIAHEIQNPLNFVNNFSEVTNELIEELKTEKLKPVTERNDRLENDLLNDITQNLEKINHHGKRADAIVKGMLQHSRSSTGQKEPTDINALADEYLRLAYHGLRAKDKSFNATLLTDFDDTIGNINIIPQDIGRVILNLITNAFYAVTEKKKQSNTAYEPTVSVSTKSFTSLQAGGGRVVNISVRDNGNGIPPKVLEKIFQPFFTTKPTGQGTGLGLSMSYDIVTKGHGGELKVETTEARPGDPVGQGEGTVFIIILPG